VTFRFKLYRPGAAAPLADVLPILEHMGLKALIEDGFKVLPDGKPVWVHEFVLRDEAGEHLVFGDIKQAFEAAFVAIWTGRAESDGFNRLVLELGIGWREAALIRALARYRQQSGLDPSQGVQEQALSDHPGVARLILDLFQTKFDPAVRADLKIRQEQAKAVEAKIVEALQAVESLDADRVLRRLAALVGAIQRTNFYQPAADGGPKPYISFKIASRELEDLPAPKPFREIYVSAPHVEGVHLRFGPVARGGLRWSDRRDDFRTEVLGLVKAQQVKNAVIVPVGSKGGFYPKKLPRGGDRDAIQAEAIRAYKTFLSGLLDLTDNIDPDNNVVPPTSVVGMTATIPISSSPPTRARRPSPTSPTAWPRKLRLLAGRRLRLRRLGRLRPQEDGHHRPRRLGSGQAPLPRAGQGHPDPPSPWSASATCPATCSATACCCPSRPSCWPPSTTAHLPRSEPGYRVVWERERMFKLPRSSWDDYDKSKISAGGGVFARA
jgi:glutamate dehydrogenase